jgi:putative flippase GtrA
VLRADDPSPPFLTVFTYGYGHTRSARPIDPGPNRTDEAMKRLSPAQRQIAAYLLFGALTTAVNFGAYTALTRLAGLGYLPSNVAAWVVSVAFAFVTNKFWVFESRSTKPGILAYETITFVSARLASGLLDTGLMYALVGVAHLPDLWSKVFVNVVVVAANYAFSKAVVFRTRPTGA